MVEQILAILIVFLRIVCIVSFALLLVHSLYYLIHEESDRQTREVRIFIILLMTALLYSSFVSVYNLTILERMGDNHLISLISAILFAVSSCMGLYVFKPWKW